MKTFEEICDFSKKSVGKGVFIYDWIGKYTEYMKAEMYVLDAYKLKNNNQYFVKKLEAERDYIKYNLEQLEEQMI